MKKYSFINSCRIKIGAKCLCTHIGSHKDRRELVDYSDLRFEDIAMSLCTSKLILSKFLAAAFAMSDSVLYSLSAEMHMYHFHQNSASLGYFAYSPSTLRRSSAW